MDIYEYSNYREYIKARIDHLRETVEGFTFRAFASDSGFKSPNFLKLIMDGKRNLSIEGSRKACKGLRLNARESEYFELLVAANQATDIYERNDLSAKLMSLRMRYSSRPVKSVNYDYFKTWYNILIREALLIPSEIPLEKRGEAFHPKLSAKEIKASLEQMLQMGLLVQDESGKWMPKEETVRTDDFFSNSALLAFHLQMMDLAKNSLTEFRGTEREIGALTLSLSPRSFVKVRELVRALKAEVLAIAESDVDKEDVFQLNLQLFPLSRGLKK